MQTDVEAYRLRPRAPQVFGRVGELLAEGEPDGPEVLSVQGMEDLFARHRNPLRAHEFDLVQHWYPPWLWLSRTSATPAYRVIQRPMQIVGQSRKGHPTPGKEERAIRTSASCDGCRSLQFTHRGPRREFIQGTMPHRSVYRALTRDLAAN
jgi:hypothetical protein